VAIASYIGETLGHIPEMAPMAESELAKVPLFLASAYQLATTEVFGVRFAIACHMEQEGGTTPAQFERHLAILRDVLRMEVVLLPGVVPSYVLTRLVRKGIPFVAEGKQLFLPFLAIHLRERQPHSYSPSTETLTAPAQAVVLSHLLGQRIEGAPLAELAQLLGYSAMTMSKVASELAARKLAQSQKRGKERVLLFQLPRPALWQSAQTLLGSPVRSTIFVQGLTAAQGTGVSAGLSALAMYTAIADGPLPVYAVWRGTLRSALRSGSITQCQLPEDADAVVEEWTYDPTKLTGTGVADRFSLYLSLRESNDERIEKELGALLEESPW